MKIPRIFRLIGGMGLLMGCSTHHAITGQVVDRNGEPVDRVIISLVPGEVELFTDSDGAFMIDYLRDETGERIKLSKRTDYQVEAFRTGYHIATSDFYYNKGELVLEDVTLVRDTIRIETSDEDIDPSQYPERTQSAGATYEGE